MIARVWFDRTYEPERPWYIAYQDGRVTVARDVHMAETSMLYNPGGFTELPHGPKGVIVGLVVGTLDELEIAPS